MKDDNATHDKSGDEQFENTRKLVAQCVADIRKHRAELDAATTVLVRARRNCRHRYAFTGFDSQYSYAQCPACLDIVRWEHGLPEGSVTATSTARVPPEGKFHSVPGPENYMS
jgi:hypothetical protein